MPDIADLTLEKRHNIACQIANLFCNHPEVSAILVFGSVATGNVDERSDVDMLLICQPGILAVTDRRYLLSSIGSDWHFHGQSNDNALFADDMGALYRARLFKQLANEVLQMVESQIEI